MKRKQYQKRDIYLEKLVRLPFLCLFKINLAENLFFISRLPLELER